LCNTTRTAYWVDSPLTLVRSRNQCGGMKTELTAFTGKRWRGLAAGGVIAIEVVGPEQGNIVMLRNIAAAFAICIALAGNASASAAVPAVAGAPLEQVQQNGVEQIYFRRFYYGPGFYRPYFYRPYYYNYYRPYYPYYYNYYRPYYYRPYFRFHYFAPRFGFGITF
jgi:hypothetical protein